MLNLFFFPNPYSLIPNPSSRQYEIDDAGGDGEESAVEAVEQASVPGQDLAAVLDAELALDMALHQVAPSAEEDNDKGKAQPSPEGH